MSEKKATVLLEHYLKQLKLPTMMCEYASLVAKRGRWGKVELSSILACAKRRHC